MRARGSASAKGFFEVADCPRLDFPQAGSRPAAEVLFRRARSCSGCATHSASVSGRGKLKTWPAARHGVEAVGEEGHACRWTRTGMEAGVYVQAGCPAARRRTWPTAPSTPVNVPSALASTAPKAPCGRDRANNPRTPKPDFIGNSRTAMPRPAVRSSLPGSEPSQPAAAVRIDLAAGFLFGRLWHGTLRNLMLPHGLHSPDGGSPPACDSAPSASCEADGFEGWARFTARLCNSGLPVINADDQALAEHPRRPRHRVQRDRHVPRVQQAIQLRPAGLKFPRHGLFGLLLPLHLPRELPCQHAFDRDRFHFLPNTFLFQKTVEARPAMVEGDLLPSSSWQPPFLFLLVAARQTQILGGSPLGLLDKSVQQHHPSHLVDVEQNPRDPILCEVSSDFVNSIFQMPARRHPERPALLNRHNVMSDAFSILRRKPP